MGSQRPNTNPNTGTQPELLNFIFCNPRGLRPGWRLLIFVAIVYGLLNLQEILLQRLNSWLPHGFAPSRLMLNETLSFLIILFASWVMSLVEHRNLGEYGLPLKNAAVLSRCIRGYIFWGFLPLALLLLLMRALHAFYFGNLALHGDQILYWGALWWILFMLVGLTEEYSLRGYALYTLAEGIGFWPAAVVLASLFALLHTFNRGETRIGILMTAVFAMFAATTLRYTGNLWIAVGIHAGWDWGQSYFFGVNDSGIQLPGHLLNPSVPGPAWLTGGSTGPEGSVLCIVLLVVLTVLFVLFYRKPQKPALVIAQQISRTP